MMSFYDMLKSLVDKFFSPQGQRPPQGLELEIKTNPPLIFKNKRGGIFVLQVPNTGKHLLLWSNCYMRESAEIYYIIISIEQETHLPLAKSLKIFERKKKIADNSKLIDYVLKIWLINIVICSARKMAIEQIYSHYTTSSLIVPFEPGRFNRFAPYF